VSRSEAFTPVWLVFFDGHVGVSETDERDFGAFFGQDRAFFGAVWSPFWLVVPGKGFSPVN
jgi:hypothetical protein